MGGYSASTPAFGEADLSNCEREQIHLAGSIQPHGVLLVCREPDFAIIQASANASEFLGVSDLPGLNLADLEGDILERIRPWLDDRLNVIPMAVRCTAGTSRVRLDALIHRPPEGGLIVELERAGPAFTLLDRLESAVAAILASSSLRNLCDESAKILRELTGYDRVMVYRFDQEGHGEVFSERRRPDLEAYLGNRYPSTDIPQIARRLYERNRVRVLADVDYQPVALLPRLSPLTGRDLDLSLCYLRSMSPIHVQYLKNMGVAATFVLSLIVKGKLWGLIACHHYEPRIVEYELRAACEVLAEAIAIRIAALESFVQAQAEISVRRLEQGMIEAISTHGDWKVALFDRPQSLPKVVGATGAALLFEGRSLTEGEVPGTQELREIAAWLDAKPREQVFATPSLGLDEPAFARLIPFASGLLATRISNSAGEYLLWFRAERIRTVTWGGDPMKPMVVGSDPSDLSPRRSFAQWHQVVEGTSDPWTEADLTTARLIGDTVSDIILQFRSVRMLIAQDQLEQVSRQVRSSDQPVILADPGGRILLSNESFDRLLWAGHAHVQWLEDLAPFFADPTAVRVSIGELLGERRSWRGEVRLKTSLGVTRPLMVRADPVYSLPGVVLGFVLLFTDLTERKAAEAARRRFQEEIVEHRIRADRRGSMADLAYRNLLSSIVGNAQLAALEIADRVDVAHMPEMLEAIRASVARTTEVLDHLMVHARSDAGRDRT